MAGTCIASCLTFFGSALRYPNDDQFILFRYIDNIANGSGFVYTVGERVLGATTPLFTLIGAAARFLIPDVSTPDLVAVLNIVFLSLAAVFFYKLACALVSKRLAFLSVAIFALGLARTIPEGMETPLFLLTTFASLYFLYTGRHITASVLLALSVLTRPDAALIALLIGIHWLAKVGVARTVRLSLIATATLLPWLAFATWYFGSFVPQSLLTKLHSSEIYLMPVLQAAQVQLAHVSRMYWGAFFDPSNIPLQIIVNLLPVLALAALGTWFFVRKGAWLLPAIPLVYFVSFSLSNPIIFPWYLSEMEPFWILLSVAGVGVVLARVRQKIAFVLVLLLLSGPAFSFFRLATTDDPGSKVPLFNAASFVRERMDPRDTVGAADIGIVGYVTNAPLVDFIGLVSPDSVAYYPIEQPCPEGNLFYRIPPLLLKESKPAWVIANEEHIDSCFKKEEWFQTTYAQVFLEERIGVWQLRD